MLTLIFDYLKGTEISKRVLTVWVQPSTMYAGIDISELDPETQALYIQEVSKCRNAHFKELDEINERYDLKYRYRQFRLDNMRNIKREET